ncbi:MAG: nucleotide-binding protein [candidate division Zixibacteria bacterium]|nr:nucleotide-binding protein [candidate division Zixibacteria bacterium]
MQSKQEVYHIVARIAKTSEEVYEFDLTREAVYAKILEPLRNGKKVNIGKKRLSSSDIEGNPEVLMTKENSNFYMIKFDQDDIPRDLPKHSRIARIAEDVTSDFFEDNTSNKLDMNSNCKRVFVVHGRDNIIKDAMYDFLSSANLEPMSWEELVESTDSASPDILSVLLSGAKKADAFVCLLTPDDVGNLSEKFQRPSDPKHEKELTPQPRLNVVFETGMALALNRKNTLIVEFGSLRPFSDKSVHSLRMNSSNETDIRDAILSRLETAGLKVKRRSGRWTKAGKFQLERFDSENPIPQTLQTPGNDTKIAVEGLRELLEEFGSSGEVEKHFVSSYTQLISDASKSIPTADSLRIVDTDYEVHYVPRYNIHTRGYDKTAEGQRIPAPQFRLKIKAAIRILSNL